MSAINVSLGRRLRWPDDYFALSHSASYQYYNLFNYGQAGLPIANGNMNQISFTNTLSRNSLNNPVFPTSGSTFTLSVAATPPYSVFFGSPRNLSDKYRRVEFHKWMLDGSYFIPIAKNLVFNTRAHFGFLGYYTKEQGIGPFERFKLGGSGITGFNFLIGYDIIGLRGYNDNSISPTGTGGAGIIYNKYVTELRYALSTNPAATIFVLGFAEGGNNVGRAADFNPFNIYRSWGGGVRIMMPAFGLLGVDYGFALDGTPSMKNGFTFTIGQQLR
jgi:outer membrane protein insertion porin family